jgi:RHS repeat-associated protein
MLNGRSRYDGFFIMAYQYNYQGQERQDELNLNWDSFKWRNYDYAIGRFMSIDPLAEKYPYNSTYTFQENKMGLGVELEGLELERVRGGILDMLNGLSKAIAEPVNVSRQM